MLKTRPLYSARTILIIIAVILLGLGIYHYSTRGTAWRSGTTEVATASVLSAAAYLIYRAEKRKPGLLYWAMAIVIMFIIVIVGTAIYHLTHGGWRSGITEIVITGVLGFVEYLLYLGRRG